MSWEFVACFVSVCIVAVVMSAMKYSYENDKHDSYLDHIRTHSVSKTFVTFLQNDGTAVSIRKDKITAFSEEEAGTVIWLDQVPMLVKEKFSDVMDALMEKKTWRTFQPAIGSMFYSCEKKTKEGAK